MTEEHATPNEKNEPNRERPADQTIRDTAEMVWDKTRRTLQSTAALAGQYKKIAEKKIDLAAVHKKISLAHSQLGKLLDEKRETSGMDILSAPEISELLQHLDRLKIEAANLVKDIETIRKEP